jgi:excisionase family DNA binding protein
VSQRNRDTEAPANQGWPEVLTAHEVADYLRINYMTVLKMTRDGRLPALAIGREYRYLRAEVERLMRFPGEPPTGE